MVCCSQSKYGVARLANCAETHKKDVKKVTRASVFSIKHYSSAFLANPQARVQRLAARKRRAMSSRTLRIAGWLLVIAAVISLVSTVLGIVIPGPAGPNGPPTNFVSIINIVAGVLFLVSLPSAY